jgi:hypothetical protein
MYTEEVLNAALAAEGLLENVKNNIIKIIINPKIDKFNKKIADFNAEIIKQQDLIKNTIYLTHLQKINIDIKFLHDNLASDLNVLQALFDKLNVNKEALELNIIPTLDVFNNNLNDKKTAIAGGLVNPDNKVLASVCQSNSHAVCALIDNLKNNDFLDSNIEHIDKLIYININTDAEILRGFLIIIGDKSKGGYTQMENAQLALYKKNIVTNEIETNEIFYKNYINSLLSNRIDNLYAEIDRVAAEVFKEKYNGSNLINLLQDAQPTGGLYSWFITTNTLKGLTEDLINQKINESKTLSLPELQDLDKQAALRQQIANDYEKLLLKQLGNNIATELFKDNNDAVFNQLVSEEIDENILEYLRSKIIKDSKISNCYETTEFHKSFELRARNLLEEYKTNNSANLSKGKATQKTNVALGNFQNLVQEKLNLLKSTTELTLEQVKTVKSDITAAKDTLLSNHPEAQTAANFESFNGLINLADQIISYGDAVGSRREKIDETINLFLSSEPPRNAQDLEDKITLPALTPPESVKSTLNLSENKQLSESLARGNNILIYNKAQEIFTFFEAKNSDQNQMLNQLNDFLKVCIDKGVVNCDFDNIDNDEFENIIVNKIGYKETIKGAMFTEVIKNLRVLLQNKKDALTAAKTKALEDAEAKYAEIIGSVDLSGASIKQLQNFKDQIDLILTEIKTDATIVSSEYYSEVYNNYFAYKSKSLEHSVSLKQAELAAVSKKTACEEIIERINNSTDLNVLKNSIDWINNKIDNEKICLSDDEKKLISEAIKIKVNTICNDIFDTTNKSPLSAMQIYANFQGSLIQGVMVTSLLNNSDKEYLKNNIQSLAINNSTKLRNMRGG